MMLAASFARRDRNMNRLSILQTRLTGADFVALYKFTVPVLGTHDWQRKGLTARLRQAGRQARRSIQHPKNPKAVIPCGAGDTISSGQARRSVSDRRSLG